MIIFLISVFLLNPIVQDVLTIGSFIFAIISLILAIYFYRKQKEAKRDIIWYSFSEPLDIGKGLSHIFPGLQMTFNKSPIEENLKYIEGQFKNVSDNDISTTGDYNIISLKLPVSCSIIDVQITNIITKKDTSLQIEKTYSNNSIQFKLPGVLYSKDCFKFSAIYIDPSQIVNSVKTETNIPNISLQGGTRIDSNVLFRFALFITFFSTLFCSLEYCIYKGLIITLTSNSFIDIFFYALISAITGYILSNHDMLKLLGEKDN